MCFSFLLFRWVFLFYFVVFCECFFFIQFLCYSRFIDDARLDFSRLFNFFYYKFYLPIFYFYDLWFCVVAIVIVIVIVVVVLFVSFWLYWIDFTFFDDWIWLPQHFSLHRLHIVWSFSVLINLFNSNSEVLV